MEIIMIVNAVRQGIFSFLFLICSEVSQPTGFNIAQKVLSQLEPSISVENKRIYIFLSVRNDRLVEQKFNIVFVFGLFFEEFLDIETDTFP